MHSTGYKIPFHKKPPRVRIDSKEDPKTAHFMDAKVQELMKMGVVSRAGRAQSGEGNILPAFLLKKSSGGHRFIHDLRLTNLGARFPKRKLKTLDKTLPLIGKHAWLASLDLKNAYYLVKLHQESRKWVQFSWRGVVYRFNRLPMGLSPSMHVFSAYMAPVVKFLTLKLGHAIICDYADDILFIFNNTTRAKARSLMTRAMQILDALDIEVARKSKPEPTKRLEHLGFVINTATNRLSIPGKKITDIKRHLKRCLKRGVGPQGVRLSHLASTIGKLVAALPVVKLGRLHMDALHAEKIYMVKNFGWGSPRTVRLSREAIEDLSWWMDRLTVQATFRKPWEMQISRVYTDAADNGWGGVLYSAGTKEWIRGRFLGDRRHLHINVKEVAAMWEALLFWGPKLRGQHVRGQHVNVLTDNITTRAAINRWYCRSQAIKPLIAKIFGLCEEYGVHLSASYIPTAQNVEADALSRDLDMPRLPTSAEYGLARSKFEALCEELDFKPRIDLFASSANAKLSAFVDIRQDAFKVSWPSKAYAFPPPNQLNKLLDRLQASRKKTEVLVVTPAWTGKPWFGRLARMARAAHILQPRHALLSSSRHAWSPRFQLVGWLVSASPVEKKRWGKLRRLHKPPPSRRPLVCSAEPGDMAPQNLMDTILKLSTS